MPTAKLIVPTTISAEAYSSHILANGNAYYYNGDTGGFFEGRAGFVYSTSPISISVTISGGYTQEVIILSPGQTILKKEYPVDLPGTSLDASSDTPYSLSLPATSDTTYYIRAYMFNSVSGWTEYGSQITTNTNYKRGYYVSNTTVGFFDPLQIRNSGESQESILVSDSSGLVSWKPVRQAFSSGHYIGELYGGGVVAAVWREGDDEKVLIVSTEDVKSYIGPFSESFNVPWTTDIAQTTEVGASNKYSGYLNTAAILAQAGSLGTTYSAARGAADYRGGGFEDWYLPSYFELNQVFNNAAIINKVLDRETFAFEKSQDPAYWTSNESTLPSQPASSFAIILNGNQLSNFGTRAKSSTAKIRPVRKESFITGDGLVLALDATNKKSFSDIEYVRTGTASRWRCLVNAGLTNSYHFALGTWPKTYFGASAVTSAISPLNGAGATENLSKRKYGSWTLTAINGTTSPSLYNNTGTSSIVSDYFTPAGIYSPMQLDITDGSTTPSATSSAVDISVSVVENGVPTEYYLIWQVKNTSGTNNLGLKIPLTRYIGKSISVKIEAPNANYISSTNKSGPIVNNITFTNESGTHIPTGPIYNASESGFFRFNGTGSNADSNNSYGSYVDFNAPIGNTNTVTVEIWSRLGSNYLLKFMFGWDTYGVCAVSNGAFGFNTGNGDCWGISAARVQQLGLVGNWKHYAFVMKGAGSATYSNNKMYINGEEQILSAQVAPYDISLGVENPANRNFSGGRGRIGGISTDSYGQNMYLFNGDISVVRIYSRQLSKDEIMKNYSKEKKRYKIPPSVLRDGLLTHIDFNDSASYALQGTANGTIFDISGNGRNADLTIGTLTPLIRRSNSLYEGRSLYFPGTSAGNPMVKWTTTAAPNSAINLITQRLSVSLWVRVDAPVVDGAPADGIIVAKSVSDTTSSSWQLSMQTSKLVFSIRSLTNVVSIATNTLLSASVWTHVCATYDSSIGRVRLYLNSSLDREYFVQPGFTLQSSTGGMYLGEYPNGTSPMLGAIESFQLYDRELSYEEVRNNYDSAKHAFEKRYSDSNQFYSHEINRSPTFSISQNLTLKLGLEYNQKVLKLGDDGFARWVDSTNVFTRPTNQRVVGDLYAGGIIVAAWAYPKSVFNYLIMSTQDIAQNVAWSNVAAAASSATSDFRGDTNTTAIIGQSANSAAQLCRNYNGGGYTDWYLPSTFELNQAFNAASIIGTITGTDSFSGGYWSSTEVSNTQAYAYLVTEQNSGTRFGYQKAVDKTGLYDVRAFRFATTAVTTTPWRPWWRDEYPIWIEWEQNWNPINYWNDYNWEFNYFSFTNVSTGQMTYSPGGSTMFGPYPPSNFYINNSSVSTSEIVIEFGVCYVFASPFTSSLDYAIPTTSDSKVVGSGAYSQFTVYIPVTVSNTTPTFVLRTRAYAITNSGTYYGSVVSGAESGN